MTKRANTRRSRRHSRVNTVALCKEKMFINPEDMDTSSLLNTAAGSGSLKSVEDLLKNDADVNMLSSSKFGRDLTPLHSAVKNNQVEVAKLLIKYDADVNVKDGQGKPPIIDAIVNMNTEMTNLLLTNGADIKEDSSSLCTAARSGSLIIVEDLLKHGADINMVNSSTFGRDHTPLHSAVKNKQVEVAELLINYGANVNVKDSKGKTPIVYVIENWDTEIHKLILTNKDDRKKEPSLLCTVAGYGSRKLIEVLLKYGADVNMLNSSTFERDLTPLHSAVIKNQVEVVKLFIKYGANVNVNVKDGEGRTPIVYAIENRNTEMTKLLLTNGADIKEDSSLLCTAAGSGSLIIVEDLLKYSADVNMLNRSGFGESVTPLHSAVENNQVEVAELLINNGANVNVKDGKGGTPIVYVIENWDTETHKLVLTNGADRKQNPSLLCAAAGYGSRKFVEVLLKYGADVNMLSSSRFGRYLMPLHSAVIKNQVEVAKLLIKYGANVNVKDGKRRSPIVYAIENKNTEMTKLLLTNGADIKEHPGLLSTAAGNGSLIIVEDLLKYGADINMLSSSSWGRKLTPLHNAVKNKQLEVAKLLISYGANVNVKDDLGIGPIIDAVISTNTEMINLLFTNGANIKECPRLLCAAAEFSCMGIVEELLKHGTDVDMLNSWTGGRDLAPLHIAVKNNQVGMVKRLIKHGANVNVKDSHGRTPIVYAVENSCIEMTKLLLNNGADRK